MKFEAIAREAVLLDPSDNLARKTIPNEIRRDPLTGKTSRICHFRELVEKAGFGQTGCRDRIVVSVLPG